MSALIPRTNLHSAYFRSLDFFLVKSNVSL